MHTHLPAATPDNAVVESTGRHAHDTVQVAWVCTGMGRVYCRGAAHDAAAGAVVVVPPGEMHHGHSVGAEGWRYRILDAAPLEEIAAEIPGRRTAEWTWVASRDPALAAAFARWAGAAEGLEASSLAWEAMAALVYRGGPLPPAGRETAAVREAVAFLEAHWAEPVPLERLARVAGVSRFHLARAFKREVGLPPHAYQTQLRVAHAMRMLRRGWSISRAAFATGFAAQSHLHRHFKRVLGVTPGQYAARARTLKLTRRSGDP